MFQCYTLNSPHPLLSRLRPQVCSLCLLLSDFHFTVHSANILTFTPVLIDLCQSSYHWTHHTHRASLALSDITGHSRTPCPCGMDWRRALLLRHCCSWYARVCAAVPATSAFVTATISNTANAPGPKYQSYTVVYSKVGVECFYPSICHMQGISKGGLLLPPSLSECAAKATFLHFIHTLLLGSKPQETGWGRGIFSPPWKPRLHEWVILTSVLSEFSPSRLFDPSCQETYYKFSRYFYILLVSTLDSSCVFHGRFCQQRGGGR